MFPELASLDKEQASALGSRSDSGFPSGFYTFPRAMETDHAGVVCKYDGGALWRSADRDSILAPVLAHGQPVFGYGGACARECAHFLDNPHHWDYQSALAVHCCDLHILAADAEMGRGRRRRK
jgi:hypothetical protein